MADQGACILLNFVTLVQPQLWIIFHLACCLCYFPVLMPLSHLSPFLILYLKDPVNLLHLHLLLFFPLQCHHLFQCFQVQVSLVFLLKIRWEWIFFLQYRFKRGLNLKLNTTCIITIIIFIFNTWFLLFFIKLF